MAEQEVVKHTKKVYKIWNSNQHGFWHKVKEFFIEMAIIVVAISLSIWFHDRSEHKHAQKEVKVFLLGLREDFLQDLKEMQDDKDSYTRQMEAFRYVTRGKINDTLSRDSLRKYNNWLFNTTRLLQNNGRFEGFKASGKIGQIEDTSIQNGIMDLYQENIPSLLISSDFYLEAKRLFFEYCFKNRKRTSDSTTNLAQILKTDEAQNICQTLSSGGETIDRYQICIDKMHLLVNKIEEKYGIREND